MADGTTQVVLRTGGRFLILGGSVLALVTWAERFVGPLVIEGRDVVLEPGPARVLHLVSYLAIVLIPIGLAAMALELRRGGRAAVLACTGIAAGFVLGALPHTVLDFGAIPTVFDRLPEDQARDLVDRFYAVIGPVAGVGLLVLVLGAVTLGVLGLRRALLPRPVAVASLLALPAAIALGALDAAFPDVPVPHAPVAFDLLLVVYGWHLLQLADTAEASTVGTGRSALTGT